jgi:hypothetical protein
MKSPTPKFACWITRKSWLMSSGRR